MGYDTAGLFCIVPHVGQGPGLWHYVGIDAHATVDAANFFSDGDDKGLRVGDTMMVHDNTTPFGVTMHRVTVVTAGGAGSIGAALFS